MNFLFIKQKCGEKASIQNTFGHRWDSQTQLHRSMLKRLHDYIFLFLVR
jgi:hypothetical protein